MISVVPEVASWELGDGESAVLSWAVQSPGWTVLVDDRAGRRFAKEEEHISEVEPVLDALVNAGLQASEALLETVLRQAGGLE